MRTKYCCDVKAHENYYLHQVGHGGPISVDQPIKKDMVWVEFLAPLQKRYCLWSRAVQKQLENKFYEAVSVLHLTS